MDTQISIPIFVVLLLITFFVIWRKNNNRRKKKQNTYQVVGNRAIPAFPKLQPKPTTIFEYLLPGQHVVITRKKTFYRIEGTPAGWIRGRDLEGKGGDRYEVMAEYGALLLNAKGEETGEFLPYQAAIEPVEHIQFGYVEELKMWIDMENLKRVYRVY